ncbi:DUF1453 domain-containing protein [Streptomyces sp. NPDC057654]|uniref:DUF1453 domain-containing protein n=1 Tax=Streptomyces sp. NPDC057654 TaxID=3346196 RepID=UPI0036AC99BC
MIGEPAEAKRMLILPAVLSLVGLSNLSGGHLDVDAVVFLVGTGALSVLLGVLRGVSIRLSNRDGLVFMRYTWVTVALWVLNIVAKIGANLLLGAIDPHMSGVASDSLLLTIGIGMLAEGLMVLGRAVRTDSRVVWTAGKDGQPHTSSALLDSLQERFAGASASGTSADNGTSSHHRASRPSMLDALRDADSRQDRRHS